MFLHESTPCQQNSLILLQLLHEGRVRLGDGPSFLHIVKGGVQVPAILLHSVGYHCGSRAAHAHLTVNQTLGTGFPKVGRERGRVEAHELVRKRSLNCVCVCVCRSLLGFGDELVRVVPVLQQVGGLLVVHSDVVVFKHSWKKVVDFPGHIQDVAHSGGATGGGVSV